MQVSRLILSDDPTPLQRTPMLKDQGALSSSALERVIVDCSHIDQKKRDIFDMQETQGPLTQLLNRPELKSRYGSDKGEVLLIMY